MRLTPKYIASEIVKWTEYGLQRGAIYLTRLFIKRRRTPPTLDFNRSKVLFLRQNQIGDTLVSTPIFAALKQRYPNITLDVLLDRRNASALDGDANIHKRYIIKQTRFDIFTVLRNIRREHYDVVVDLIHSASSTSTLLCLFSNAKFYIGFKRENDFIYDVALAPNENARMLMQLAQVLKPFGIEPQTEALQPYFHLPDHAIEFAEQESNRLRGNDAGKFLIGINISASTELKFWGIEKFVQLIRSLKNLYPDAAIVVMSSKAYRPQALDITSDGILLATETKTLQHFAALISTLDLLITPDSAAVHFADIFRVPSVILANTPNGASAWYPSFTEFVSVHSPQLNISAIGVEAVLAACERVVEKLMSEKSNMER
jgi:ADP-heptose:LPS heptosyltransferase